MSDLKDPYEAVNPKDLVAASGKVPIGLVPPALMIETAPAMANGGGKYGPYNWREKDVNMTVYIDAAIRHLFACRDGEDVAEDSGVDHLSHASACLAIIFDARGIGKLRDDRPVAGPSAKLLNELADVSDKAAAVGNEARVAREQRVPPDYMLHRDPTLVRPEGCECPEATICRCRVPQASINEAER